MPSHARFSYFGDPAKTAGAWRGDAFTVGDMGRLDADGYLYLKGRRDDLIITGGVNVYPMEVETVLVGHPGVDDVAVYGVPDERWGQRVCAAVVGTATPAQLIRSLANTWRHPNARRPGEFSTRSHAPSPGRYGGWIWSPANRPHR